MLMTFYAVTAWRDSAAAFRYILPQTLPHIETCVSLQFYLWFTFSVYISVMRNCNYLHYVQYLDCYPRLCCHVHYVSAFLFSGLLQMIGSFFLHVPYHFRIFHYQLLPFNSSLQVLVQLCCGQSFQNVVDMATQVRITVWTFEISYMIYFCLNINLTFFFIYS